MDSENSKLYKFALNSYLFIRAIAPLIKYTAVLVFSIYVVYKLSEFINNLNITKDHVPIITASIGAVVSISVITVGKFIEVKHNRIQKIREEQLPTYESFVRYFFKEHIEKTALEGKNYPKKFQESIKFFNDFTIKMIVWGSDRMLREWINLRQDLADSSNLEGSAFGQQLFNFEDFLFYMRRSVGHNNRQIKRKDILRLFINDIDSY